MKHEQVIQDMFAAFTNFDADPNALFAFMTPDYRQCVDGHEMTLSAFQTHTRALRANLSRLEIDIQHIVCEGNKAATVHVLHTSLVRKV